jgi:hypothetical protein
MLFTNKGLQPSTAVALLLTAGALPGAGAVLTSWSAPVNVTSINSADNDLSPHLSPNGLSLFFASTRPGGLGGEDLWVARRNSLTDNFGPPVSLGGTINTPGAERSPALSNDGLSLFYATTRPGGSGGFDLWVSKRSDVNDDFGWQTPENLGALINSSGVDAGPSHLYDPVAQEESLYFASNRSGGLDLYLSRFAAVGSAGAPSPIRELNTSALDLTPAVRSDGLEIIFASNRNGAMGLWMSTRSSPSDPWLPPVSLGPQFQIGAEGFPALSSDGKELYFYSSRPGGSGSFDIYRSVRSEVPEPQSILLCGLGLLLLRSRGIVNRLFARRIARSTQLSAIVLLLVMSQVGARADVVTEWNEIMLAAVASQNSFAQARFAAVTQLAVFEAVNTIAGAYKPYVGTIRVDAGASVEAAAVAAAHRVLRTYFASEAGRLDAERARTLAGIPDGVAKVNGIAVGEAAADVLTALRENDGSGTPMAYTPLIGAGFWQPTPSAFAPATLLHWARVTPFGTLNAYQFAVPPPPAHTSARYRRDYEEVKRVGGATSTDRTQDEANLARFVAMTSPIQVWNRVALQLAAKAENSLLVNARTLALLNMAISDSSVSVFALKYHYQTWRPVTAIRAGDTDGNPDTEPDPGFTPFITPPTFPGYPSAHASGSAAARYVLEHMFGRGKHKIALSNPALPGVTLSYTKLQQITDDIDDGRVYGGIHFRFDQEAGSVLGLRVARHVVKHNLTDRHSGDREGDEKDADVILAPGLP